MLSGHTACQTTPANLDLFGVSERVFRVFSVLYSTPGSPAFDGRREDLLLHRCFTQPPLMSAWLQYDDALAVSIDVALSQHASVTEDKQPLYSSSQATERLGEFRRRVMTGRICVAEILQLLRSDCPTREHEGALCSQPRKNWSRAAVSEMIAGLNMLDLGTSLFPGNICSWFSYGDVAKKHQISR